MMRKSPAIQLLCLIYLYLNPQGNLVGAYFQNPNGKILSKESTEQFKDRSSNEILVDEMKQKLADQHHYYLPMQTTFGSPLKPSSYEGYITSPPHVTITPSSVETSYVQSSEIEDKVDTVFNDDHITAYLSQCITETPSKDEQPKSNILLPSEKLIPKSVILSGHIEIPSKTSIEISASKISNTVSEIPLMQGTHIYMSSVTDV